MKKRIIRCGLLPEHQKAWGLSLVKLLLSLGAKVVATSRILDDLESSISAKSENFLPLKVDITSEQDVKESVGKAVEKFGRLDIVFS